MNDRDPATDRPATDRPATDRPATDRDVAAPYLVARVRDALVHDAKVAELDIAVRVVGDDVFLTGTVATADRVHAVETLVRELLPDRAVHNQLTAVPTPPPTTSETVR